jgi:predicted membrane-bound spermidine synthase
MKKILVYTIAFLGGGVFLGMEIVASRILAPYFGNSIYVWGSLISVFLLALSIGYYYGGVLADKSPSFKSLSVVILCASLFILIIPFVYIPVSIYIVDLNLEFRFSVLLACNVLFLIPSILMGMISPYIVKLDATELKKIGHTAGSVYAVSTLGSISGALVVSFFLIPVIGTRSIIYLSGGILLFTSILCLIAHKLVRPAPE